MKSQYQISISLSKISFYQELVISYCVFAQRVPYTSPNIKLIALDLFIYRNSNSYGGIEKFDFKKHTR